jgi:hypothetical protein
MLSTWALVKLPLSCSEQQQLTAPSETNTPLFRYRASAHLLPIAGKKAFHTSQGHSLSWQTPYGLPDKIALSLMFRTLSPAPSMPHDPTQIYFTVAVVAAIVASLKLTYPFYEIGNTSPTFNVNTTRQA